MRRCATRTQVCSCAWAQPGRLSRGAAAALWPTGFGPTADMQCRPFALRRRVSRPYRPAGDHPARDGNAGQSGGAPRDEPHDAQRRGPPCPPRAAGRRCPAGALVRFAPRFGGFAAAAAAPKRPRSKDGEWTSVDGEVISAGAAKRVRARRGSARLGRAAAAESAGAGI